MLVFTDEGDDSDRDDAAAIRALKRRSRLPLIGEPARWDLARHTSFLAAWREGLSPHEAVADAKSRSMPHSPRWRMRWKQSA